MIKLKNETSETPLTLDDLHKLGQIITAEHRDTLALAVSGVLQAFDGIPNQDRIIDEAISEGIASASAIGQSGCLVLVTFLAIKAGLTAVLKDNCSPSASVFCSYQIQTYNTVLGFTKQLSDVFSKVASSNKVA